MLSKTSYREEFDFSKIEGKPCIPDEERLAQIEANLATNHRRLTYRTVEHIAPFREKPMIGKVRTMVGHYVVWGIPAPHERTASLYCYGPSLKDTVSDIHGPGEVRFGDVVTVSGAHDFLVERGIVPEYHIECDPRRHKGMMLTPNDETKYLMASCVHPDVIRKVGNPILWNIADVPGGGSVGLRAIPLLYCLGYRKFVVHGMDLSFRDGEFHAGKHTGDVPIQVIEVECKGRLFKTSLPLMRYMDCFQKYVQPHIGDSPAKIQIELRGDGLLKHWVGL